jgi:tight adherence protein B
VTRARAVLACTVAIVLSVVSVASASTQSITIKSVDISHFPTSRVTIVTSDGQPPSNLTVTENGRPAADLTTFNAAHSAAIALAIDTSQSMSGKPLTDAVAAAGRFVYKQAPDALLAVYGFDSSAYSSAPFPASRITASNALNALATGPKPGTAIYSSVVETSHDLAQQPASKRVLVLLTDGSSAGETTTIAQALAAAKAAHVVIYAVSTTSAGPGIAPLRQLTTKTGGKLIAVSDSSALGAAYDGISQSLGSPYQFQYQSQAPYGKPFELQVSNGGGSPAAELTVTAPAGSAAKSSSGSGFLHLPASAGGRALIASVAALLVLVAALIVLSSKPGVGLGKRIGPYIEQRAQVPTASGVEVPKITMLHQLYVATEKVAGSLNYWKNLSFRLEQANLAVRTAEIVYIQMASGLGLALIGRVLFGVSGLFALIPLAVGLTIPVIIVRVIAKRRIASFESQLPETLITLAASLKAGHAFNSALNSVVREGIEPTSTELARVASEIQLGMPSEQALESMAKRMGSTNFGFVVMAVNIQRTVGGSLADILDMVADTVRLRQQFHRKVKALTAQGRMSAYVLMAMPFIMGLAIFAMNPTYINVLFTSTAGNIMIGGGLFMMAIGGIIIQKIVSFKG